MTAGRIPLPSDVVTKIAADFAREPFDTVLAIVDGYDGAEKLRVIRCVVHLAEGNTDQLLQLVEAARADYRDVVYQAEYDRGDRRVRDFSQPFVVTPPPGDGSLSFVGGRPFLPPATETPACGVCSARMCFFFQVALPAGHRWQGALVALFHCISCCSEDALIPEMIDAPLQGAEIPRGFLTRFQTTFRIVVGDAATALPRDDYEPLIEHAPIDQSAWRVGAEPQWLLDDETPGSYESLDDPAFLFQVPFGMTFPRRSNAPLQKTLDLAGEVVDAERPYYELFLGNASYFFGFGSAAPGRTYVVTQAE
jgi:hypothetical protein